MTNQEVTPTRRMKVSALSTGEATTPIGVRGLLKGADLE
jgi:hypothetical protein